MTPADLARANAIALEVKKDSLRQNQDGTWKITFTVQGVDMVKDLTQAMPGTRYQCVLVETGDDELPVRLQTIPTDAKPALELDKPQARAKREKMDWRELPAATQAAIRSDDVIFQAFLREEYDRSDITSNKSAAEFIRCFAGMKSRSELSTDHRKRVLWHQLDSQFSAWLANERTGA